MAKTSQPIEYFRTKHGTILHGDSLDYLSGVKDGAVDLIMTSPPFGLVRKKDYGNADADDYLEWFRPFASAFKRVLKSNGSLVIDIGGAWIPGQPTRSLYHFKLLIMLCEEFGFHLAQEFFWWNPSKLPSPAEWVNIRRIRVKDAVNCVWWLSPTPWPRADNRRILQPYSPSMKDLLKTGYRAKERPSGHDISEKFAIDNGAAIPPNLISQAHTESNSAYLRYCREIGLKAHPARFPSELPEFFIRYLTDPGDLVVDPFGGSCITGEVCERLARNWVCVDMVEEYLRGALIRFRGKKPKQDTLFTKRTEKKSNFYQTPKPGILWNGAVPPPLDPAGGKLRIVRDEPSPKKKARNTSNRIKHDAYVVNKLHRSHDRILSAIRTSLSADLLSTEWKGKVSDADPPERGHCYVATEAAYYLFGKELGYETFVAKLQDGGTHWWLQIPGTKFVIDPTFTQVVENFDYGAGRKQSMRRPKKMPSLRAQKLIERVSRRLAK